MGEKEQRPDSGKNPLFRSSKFLQRIEVLLSKVWPVQREDPPELLPLSPRTDPYKLAFAIGDLLLEYYQERGEMMRASAIENEFQQEEHFDELARLYRDVCEFMGLEWPPPPRRLDTEELPMDSDSKSEWWD